MQSVIISAGILAITALFISLILGDYVLVQLSKRHSHYWKQLGSPVFFWGLLTSYYTVQGIYSGQLTLMRWAVGGVPTTFPKDTRLRQVVKRLHQTWLVAAALWLLLAIYLVFVQKPS